MGVKVMRRSQYCVLVALFLLGSVGCRSHRLSQANELERRTEPVGAQEVNTGVDEFLRTYVIELDRSTDSRKLRSWAEEVLGKMDKNEGNLHIPMDAVPEFARTAPLQRSLIGINAINKGSGTNSYVLFVCGSGRGFHGVEVGSIGFVPPQDGWKRRRWVPGAYVYYRPPF